MLLWVAWFAFNIMGIIPLERKNISSKEELFAGCHQALDNNEILIIFPEGTRGNPEEMGHIKKGIFHLLENRENVSIIPIVLHGLGKALPKGEALLVPFNCDVIIGDEFDKGENATDFKDNLI